MRHTHLRREAEPNRRMIGLAAAVAASFALILLAAAPVQAAFPGGNGPIAFESDLDGDMDIYSIDPAAPGAPLPLTVNDDIDEGLPAWSPDGTKIAYARNPGPGTSSELWLMTVENGAVTANEPLIADASSNNEPAWSPDGTKIVFASDRGDSGTVGLHAYDVATGSVTELLDGGTNEVAPAWSPDGMKIAYAAGSDVWVVDTSGENPVNLTGTLVRLESDPEWSPDGTRIAFGSQLGLLKPEIEAMDADGHNRVNLLAGAGFDTSGDVEPAWSPDGSQIAWESDPDPAGPPTDLYAMDAAGAINGFSLLATGTEGVRSSPSWGVKPAEVTPPPGPGPEPQPSPDASAGLPIPVTAADTRAPEITKLRVSPSRFLRSAKPTARVARKRRGLSAGAKIKFTLSEAATVKITIKARGKAKKIRRGGTLTRSVRAGNSSVAFSGRIGRRALRPGSYRVTVRATDAAGNKSTARRASFRIVRR